MAHKVELGKSQNDDGQNRDTTMPDSQNDNLRYTQSSSNA